MISSLLDRWRGVPQGFINSIQAGDMESVRIYLGNPQRSVPNRAIPGEEDLLEQDEQERRPLLSDCPRYYKMHPWSLRVVIQTAQNSRQPEVIREIFQSSQVSQLTMKEARKVYQWAAKMGHNDLVSMIFRMKFYDFADSTIPQAIKQTQHRSTQMLLQREQLDYQFYRAAQKGEYDTMKVFFSTETELFVWKRIKDRMHRAVQEESGDPSFARRVEKNLDELFRKNLIQSAKEKRYERVKQMFGLLGHSPTKLEWDELHDSQQRTGIEDPSLWQAVVIIVRAAEPRGEMCSYLLNMYKGAQ